MNEAKVKALTGLLTSFPQSAADREGVLKVMLAVLDDVSEAAVRATAIKYAKGEVNGQDLRFAPTPAEFRKVCLQFDDQAKHKVWLAQNRESIQPLPAPTRHRPVRESTKAIIEGYRASYQEKLLTRPDLKYVDSIREDFTAATGKILPFKNPRTKEEIAKEQNEHENRHFGKSRQFGSAEKWGWQP